MPQRELPLRDDPRGGPAHRRRPAAHPVILKLSPDYDYLEHARLAEQPRRRRPDGNQLGQGLRLDPQTGEPYLKNRYGSLSGRAIKPIGLRIVSELREAGIRLPIIASAGIQRLRRLPRVLLGGRGRRLASAAPSGSSRLPLYVLGPLEGLRIRRLIDRVGALPGSAARRHRRSTSTRRPRSPIRSRLSRTRIRRPTIERPRSTRPRSSPPLDDAGRTPRARPADHRCGGSEGDVHAALGTDEQLLHRQVPADHRARATVAGSRTR